MQSRHTLRHLAWRAGVAVVSDAMMFTGAYPFVPYVWRARRGHHVPIERSGSAGPRSAAEGRRGVWIKSALAEWAAAIAVSALRPIGFFPLPGARVQGSRPVIVLHGYAMNRANFIPLAYRLARAGIGPIFGFEYWTLGRVAAGARQLAWFVDRVQEVTGAAQVDLVGHSMGGVVGRYYVTLGGGDGVVSRLVTLGSPHAGTDVSALGVGHPTRELIIGSTLLQRIATAPTPEHTRVITILSHADALVPASHQREIPGAERIVFDDLGHVALLHSRRVANEIIARLA